MRTCKSPLPAARRVAQRRLRRVGAWAVTTLLLGTVLCVPAAAGTLDDVPPAEPAHVSGVVTDHTTGEPLQSATVALFTPGEGSPSVVAHTDADGAYALDAAAGTYLICAGKHGGLSPETNEADLWNRWHPSCEPGDALGADAPPRDLTEGSQTVLNYTIASTDETLLGQVTATSTWQKAGPGKKGFRLVTTATAPLRPRIPRLMNHAKIFSKSKLDLTHHEHTTLPSSRWEHRRGTGWQTWGTPPQYTYNKSFNPKSAGCYLIEPEANLVPMELPALWGVQRVRLTIPLRGVANYRVSMVPDELECLKRNKVVALGSRSSARPGGPLVKSVFVLVWSASVLTEPHTTVRLAGRKLRPERYGFFAVPRAYAPMRAKVRVTLTWDDPRLPKRTYVRRVNFRDVV